MKRRQALLRCLLYTTFLMSWGSLALAGELLETVTMLFQGHIRAMKVDTCGLKPGSCQRSLVLAMSDGGEVAFAIRPEIRIKPTEQLVTVDTLRVGDFVKVQAIHLAGETSLHITMLEVMPPRADLTPSGNLRGASALGPP
jgi:hypothetical protein